MWGQIVVDAGELAGVREAGARVWRGVEVAPSSRRRREAPPGLACPRPAGQAQPLGGFLQGTSVGAVLAVGVPSFVEQVVAVCGCGALVRMGAAVFWAGAWEAAFSLVEER